MPTSTAGNSNSDSGFTLIELTIVIVLLGLFSMLVIPRMPAVGDDSLKSSARRIAGTVKYFFNEAALSGRPHRLEYNLEAGTFRVRRLEPGGELVDPGGSGREQHLKGDVRFQQITITSRGDFSHGEVSTDIQPAGWLEETIIHLEDGNGGGRLTLRIMPYTGATEIFDGFREFQ